MQKPLRILTAFIVNIFVVEPDALQASGGWSGGGSDLLQDQDNTWFIGEGSMEYCVERSADFPISLEVLQLLVGESLQEWTQFFKSYNFDKNQLGLPGTLGGLFPDGRRRGLVLSYHQVAQCNVLKKQIRILFGLSAPEIDAFRAVKGDALALAVRPDYDHESYRNGGFIWIPMKDGEKILNWTQHPNLLRHLLLHELGHVFGMRHDSTFVMSSTISYEIMNRFDHPLDRDSIYGHIEHPTWPYRFANGAVVNLTYDFGGAMGLPVGANINSSIPEELRQALGIEAQDNHSFKLRSIRDKNGAQTIVIEIGDSRSGLHSFELQASNSFSWRGYDCGPGVYTRWFSSNGEGFFARIGFDFDGDPLPYTGIWKVGSKTFPIVIAKETKATIGVRQSEVTLRVYIEGTESWWLAR